ECLLRRIWLLKRAEFRIYRGFCGVLKLFRARPNLICFNLFIYSSQPEQSMADGKIGFKGHFSPKSHLWSLQALEFQASMRSIVIPVDKLLECSKSRSMSFIFSEHPFLLFVCLRMLYSCQYCLYTLFFQMIFEFATLLAVIVISVGSDLASMCHY